MLKKKRVCAWMLVLIMFAGAMGLPVGAQEIVAETPDSTVTVEDLSVTAFSDAFPDAYIETNYVPRINAAELGNTDDEKTLIGYATATVYVEETLSQAQDGQVFVKDSRLLSKEEVDRIGKDNLQTQADSLPRIGIVGGDTTERGKLNLTFTVMSYNSPNRYQLSLVGNWEGLGWIAAGDTNHPAVGKDVIGFSWGGDFDMSGYGYDFLDTYGIRRTGYANYSPNQGIAWTFDEGPGLEQNDFVENARCWTDISKNTLTGSGNTTGIVGKYIHTWGSANFSISWGLSAGQPTLPSFSLSQAVEKSWSLEVFVSGIKY